MTRTTNARLAGFMFLFYIAVGITDMILFRQATAGAEGTAATLASIAQHATLVRGTVLLTLAQFVSAVVLGVTLYALTRDQDHDLAVLALCCRATEGAVGAVAAVRTLELLSVATASIAADSADASAALAVGAMLLKRGGGSALVAATCFALGSTIFSYLFLRARSIPVWMAWLGVVASVLLLVALPLRILAVISGPVTYYVWIPMALFEVVLALWLIIKGVAPSRKRTPSELVEVTS
jgi:Domain of unknown function (DUF4386)